ncbi:IucA/IucC family protein [Streptomyces mexicanus]|uniref:IucA/IucC family protein n=1 Tax=Streptomyces mexicanus TaxID=178566 RepID=UPI00364B1161
MTATPTPHGPSATPHDATETVPRRPGRTAPASPCPRPADVSPLLRRADTAAPDPDPLEHPDPHTAAQAAAVEALLRCWVRETGAWVRETDADPCGNGVLRIPLPAGGTTLLVPIRHWSPTGWHRFGMPRPAGAPEAVGPLDAVTVAALLARECHGESRGEPCGRSRGTACAPTSAANIPAARVPDPGPVPSPVLDPGPVPGPGPGLGTAQAVDLVARVADSVRHTTLFLRERREHPADGPDLFLSAEQALVLGHPLHPTPKSREGLTEAEVRRYSPEVRGSFPLHWLAVAPSVLASDSAWTESGRPVPAGVLTARLAGSGLSLPEGHTALPLHPWQMRELRHRADTAALLDSGRLRDLGPHGPAWSPTSSVRTVHRTGAPAMLKLSLAVRITNSRRENLRKELHRGVEVHRLLRSGLSAQWRAAHPGFDIVRDPAWLAVDDPDGAPVPGVDVLIRHNPFRPTHDVSCVAGLVAPRPRPPAGPDRLGGARAVGDPPDHERSGTPLALRSRLADVVAHLVARTGRPRAAVAVEWFLRYLEQVVRPVLWLDGAAGVALEAHQQNTLLLLDADGWPAGGRYRDNQGYYFRASRHAELDARLPGIGERSDTFVPDEVTDERFAYYLAVNNVFGLIGAFGSQRLADERLLLAAFRRFLQDAARGPARTRSTLPARLLDSPVLRCKANLLTRLHGLDELVGPVDTQSVYVTIANPLHA